MGDIIRNPLVRERQAASAPPTVAVLPQPPVAARQPVAPPQAEERVDWRAQLETERKALYARLESERQEWQVQASREGYQAGLSRGEAEAVRRQEALNGRLQALMQSVDEERQRALAEMEELVSPLLYAALAKIIGELTPSSELVASCVRRALSEARGREPMRVRLHPEDAALMVDVPAGSLDGEGRGVTIVPDRQVSGGGCVIETAGGDLDAQFTTQLERLRRVLRDARAK
ncbi:hypothetical protein BI347_00085 [Chromobacterium sphagni]|uniref:Flagellar assembly protein FliH n=1 Tax=Chromobacterium sphagni TaxID=1903179 RepID=A0A1S1WXX8_9NEIS|nr:FliH/SctL family protein [Chromobacterium sphagni]OHX12065.1 hypothetical protein BI347_00085 [Chromobacterium sphagni]